METYLYIIIGILAAIFAAGCFCALAPRLWAIWRYGKVPKPDVLNQLDGKMRFEDLKELLGDDLREETPLNYTWSCEIPNRGQWTMKILLSEEPAWTGVPFVSWTVSFESYETRYLNYEYGLLKP